MNEWRGMVLSSLRMNDVAWHLTSLFLWVPIDHFRGTLRLLRGSKVLRRLITTRRLQKTHSDKTYSYPSKILWLVVIQLEAYREVPMTGHFEVWLVQVFLWSTRATLLSKNQKLFELCLQEKIKRRQQYKERHPKFLENSNLEFTYIEW